MMQITQFKGLDCPGKAQGVAVVIDVLRAFTTAAYAFAAGTEKIILVGTPEQAFLLKKQHPDYILVGEIGGKPIAGFDFGNSPAVMAKADLHGKTLVLRSSSGTQGVVGATHARQIVLSSFVIAGATAEYLKQAKATEVSILAMGTAEDTCDDDEDVACSDYLVALLRGERANFEQARLRVLASPAAKRALDTSVGWISAEDLECALALDRFSFALPVTKEGEYFVARKADGPF